MKTFWSKYKNALAYAIVAVVCVCFFGYVLIWIGEYASGVTKQATERADFYSLEQSHYLKTQCDYLKKECEYYSDKFSKSQTKDELISSINDVNEGILGSDSLLQVLYLKDDKIYGGDGEEAFINYSNAAELFSGDQTKLTRVFQYNNEIAAIGVTSKINSVFVDKILTVYDRTAVSLFNYANDKNGEQISCVENTEFTLLCKHDGKIVDKIENSLLFEIGNEPVQDGLIKSIFNDTESVNLATQALFNGESKSFIFNSGADEYTLTITSFGAEYGGLSLICAYKVSKIYGEGYSVIQSIAAALLGLAIVLIVMAAVVVISKLSSRRKIFSLEMVVPFLNCATLKKFEKSADEILKRHSGAKFVLTSLNVNNFGYVNEHFGEESGKRLLKYIVDVIRGGVYLEETFAYADGGEFIMLLHYRDKQALIERLNGIYLRLSLFNEIGDGNYKVNASYAAYEIEREEKQTVKNMLDKLEMAKDGALSQSGTLNVCFYDDVVRKNYLKKAEIEGKMEQALKNSEFHLFYQPKYNLKKKTLDGCEILVRWYDPTLEKYHLPGEFLPVFEENGFIVKLDEFVFFKACENLAKRAESRKICYPISVNVSRITAIQGDFIDYYTRIKNKFNIKDNFITLEFTESFAYENYEFLDNVVNKLHENGFLCSIDDFGTGYSSYNILKTIKMDEIKLDKFFLSKGYSAACDQTLLESVIGMVKKLGMKVTQEGVESKDDLFRLDELGCDVIQGYYFAKPMKYSDYCEFIDKNFI